ncbi:TolC family protein [Sulfurimonas sp.]
MKISKKLLLFLIPVFLSAENLQELITEAQTNNDIIIAKKYSENASAKELASQKSTYYPTVDLGGFYKRDDAASPFQAGDTYSAYAKVGLDIYDGGKRSSQVKEKQESFKSSHLDSLAYKKSLALTITKDFFSIKSLQASLSAREDAQKALKAQLERIKKFYQAKMATIDDVQRVQSDFDTNLYNIQTIRFQILSLKSLLELKVGQKIQSFDASAFKKDKSTDYAMLDSIKSIAAQKNAMNYGANAVDSYYYPNIRIEDKYNLYSYDRLNAQVKKFAPPLDNQNTLLLTANIRLFDFGEIAKTKEAVELNARALQSQINYQTKEQKVHYELSLAQIETAKLKIISSKSALNAASSAFVTIEKKYNAGIVDYIVYLDALTKRTTTKALYESSLNDLEIAYASYYFYSGKNILEELK